MDGDWNEFGSEYDERDGPWCGYTDDHADDFNGLDGFGDLSGDTPLRVPGQSRTFFTSTSHAGRSASTRTWGTHG